MADARQPRWARRHRWHRTRWVRWPAPARTPVDRSRGGRAGPESALLPRPRRRRRSADRVRPPAALWTSPRDTVTVTVAAADDGCGGAAGRAAGEAAGDATREVGDGDVRGVRGRSGMAVGGFTDVEGRGTAGRGTDDGSGRGTAEGSGRGTADGSGRAMARGDSTTRGNNSSTIFGEVGACAGRRSVGDGNGVDWCAWAGSAPRAAPIAAAPSATAGRLCVRRIGRGLRDVASPTPFGPVFRSGVAGRAVAPCLPPFVPCAGSCPRKTRTTPPIDM